jgi:molybdenum-dependent DNA-binding transcriptional regulator ModE
MVYTVDELKRLIPKNEIADAARFCGMSYSSLWRIWQGKQEPREGTLKILKSYVEMIYDPK